MGVSLPRLGHNQRRHVCQSKPFSSLLSRPGSFQRRTTDTDTTDERHTRSGDAMSSSFGRFRTRPRLLRGGGSAVGDSDSTGGFRVGESHTLPSSTMSSRGETSVRDRVRVNSLNSEQSSEPSDRARRRTKMDPVVRLCFRHGRARASAALCVPLPSSRNLSSSLAAFTRAAAPAVSTRRLGGGSRPRRRRHGRAG